MIIMLSHTNLKTILHYREIVVQVKNLSFIIHLSDIDGFLVDK